MSVATSLRDFFLVNLIEVRRVSLKTYRINSAQDWMKKTEQADQEDGCIKSMFSTVDYDP